MEKCKRRWYSWIVDIYNNIKWFFTEIMKIYSTEESYFSKKRVESGIGFAIAEWGMVYFLINKFYDMSTTDFAIWASIQFVVAGYMVTQIQKEKRVNADREVNSEVIEEEPTEEVD